MSRRLTVAAAALAVTALIVVGCATEDPDDPGPEESAAGDSSEVEADEGADTDTDTTEGAEIVIAVAAEPDDLNPGMVGHNEVNTPGMRNVFEPLVQRDAASGELLPGLATEWRQIDELTWEFDLREGVLFHDGSEFNADVAAQVFNFLYDPDLPESERGQVGSTYGGPTVTAEASGEHLLVLRTEDPDPILPSRMYFFMMFSAEAFDDPSQLLDNPVGTGPYRFVEWDRGSHLRLEAFDGWWGHDDADALGSVGFDSATFLFRSEASVRTAMMQAGEADIAVNLSPEDCDELNASGRNCVTEGGTSTIFSQFDAYNEDSIFADQRVRAAAAHAIDTNAILDAVLGGTTVAASQLVASAVTGHRDDLEPYEFDPERSRQLLEEFEADGGVLAPVTWWHQDDRFPRVSEYVQAAAAMLEDVGFEVQVSGQESGVFSSEAYPPDFPANRVRTHTHGNNIGDLGQTASIYFREPPGGGDVGCWCRDAELFEMVRAGESLVGEERANHWEDVARHVHEEYLFHYGGHLAFSYGLSDRVQWQPPIDHYYLLVQMQPTAS